MAACSAFAVVGDVHGLPVDIKHAVNICFINWQGWSQARLSSNSLSFHWPTRIGSVGNLDIESSGVGPNKIHQINV